MLDAARQTARISGSFNDLPVLLGLDHVVLGCGGHAVSGQRIDGDHAERKLAVEERAQVLSEVTRRSGPAAALDPLDGVDQGHAVEFVQGRAARDGQGPAAAPTSSSATFRSRRPLVHSS